MVEDTTAAAFQPYQAGKTLENVINTKREGTQGFRDAKSKFHENISSDSKRQKRHSEETSLIESKRLKQDENDNETLITSPEEELFDWNKYLKETNSKLIPKHFFRHLVPECMCGFEAGMKLEVPNPDYKNAYWLATIIARAPPLILVRYEGYQDNNSEDFWCNTLSDDIHPIGWCSRNKKQLRPPKSIQHTETNWYAYLIKHLTGARKASESLFLKKSHPAHYLRTGQYIEVIDPYNPTCYWLARIMEVFSGRLFLQYESLNDSKHEFWCYYTHESLRPVGFGLEHGLTLYPPKETTPESLKPSDINRLREKILALSKRSDNSIFKSLFVGWQNKLEHNLYLGMKLEAVHPKDPTSICVASVVRVFDPYHFLVKIDNLLSAHDDFVDNSFMAHKGSPYLFPIGFCSKNNLVLNQPRGYNGKFTWDGYLKYTKSLPAPELFFQEKNDNIQLVESGMKLEAVDKENPVNICVCSVTRVVNNHIWLNIDGDTRSDQIFHVDSPDIFPVGWCETTGHELQWPRPNRKYKCDGCIFSKAAGCCFTKNTLHPGCKFDHLRGDCFQELALEQKNRISSLRHNETRKKRLEVLRKGKLRKDNVTSEEHSTKQSKRKRKQKVKRYGRRGVSRKRIVYETRDDEDNSITDTSVAIVCINRLAEEYNSEDSIKQFFRLDADGRLPKEIVTIDDDDDDDDDEDDDNKKRLSKEKCSKPTYTESELNFFSFIRVKPKNLTTDENELFQLKMKENDGNQGERPDNSAATKTEKRSLNSVVAMLRATRRQGRSHLTQLEQYKQNKEKNKSEQTSPNVKNKRDKENIVKKQVIDLCAEEDVQTPSQQDLRHLEQDGSIKIPGKGEYRIVEKIVTKQGDKNKIILKLGKPAQSQGETKTTSVTKTTTVNPTTRVEDMHTLQNMARSHPGVDEIMRNRFNKVRSFCKDLPKNPLQWSNKHVAMFVKNADMAKHAKSFFDQEVDGHSFLLLTVQEIHHILGVHLGPAMKLHDYIYTLQQLVNDAYITKYDADGGSTLRDTDTVILEKDCSVTSTSERSLKQKDNHEQLSSSPKYQTHQPRNIDNSETHHTSDANVVQWLNESVLPEHLKREKTGNSLSEQSKIAIDNIKSLLVDTDKTNIENDVSSSSLHHSNDRLLTIKSTTNSTISKPIQILSTSSYSFIPVSNFNSNIKQSTQTLQMIQIQPQRIAAEFPSQLNTQLIPIQYMSAEQGQPPTAIQYMSADQTNTPIQYMSAESKPHAATNFYSHSALATAITSNRFIAPKPTEKKSEEIIYHHETSSAGTSGRQHIVSERKDLEPLIKRRKVMSYEPSQRLPEIARIGGYPVEPRTDHPFYRKYLQNINVTLESKELWNKFDALGTEMILTRLGRRMFPSLQIRATGMNHDVQYAFVIDFIPADHCRYKYEYEAPQWMVACEETTPTPANAYVHPESPSTGEIWMRGNIDFTKCKLTNNINDRKGHILMHSMHKYQPRVNVVYWDGSLPLQISPTDILKHSCYKQFTFEETKFIAVTAYQNSQITQLKIQSNPFARGFRGDSRDFVSPQMKRMKNKHAKSNQDLPTQAENLLSEENVNVNVHVQNPPEL